MSQQRRQGQILQMVLQGAATHLHGTGLTLWALWVWKLQSAVQEAPIFQ